jgi:hypothetical protein
MLLHGIYTSNQDSYYSIAASPHDGVPVGNPDSAEAYQDLLGHPDSLYGGEFLQSFIPIKR